MLLAPQPLLAQSETFVANAACPAFQSKRKRTNPGNVETEPGTAYEVVEKNPSDPDFVRVRVPGAPGVQERWVPTACGASSQPRSQQTPTADAGAQEATRNVLAVAWQPATCEELTRARECRLLNEGRLPDAERQFSIHGLWPQDESFCGNIRQSRRFRDLPAPRLSRQTRAQLEDLMPAHRSALERHQWAKHGTCYRAAGGAEEYFADTIALTVQLNASSVASLFAQNVGRRLSREEVRRAFDDAFGKGAGARVSLRCADDRDNGRQLIQELRINLSGRIDNAARLGDLMRAAPRARGGCRGGIVDPAGNQR